MIVNNNLILCSLPGTAGYPGIPGRKGIDVSKILTLYTE